jgi:peroxiredoxin Q/BCP
MKSINPSLLILMSFLSFFGLAPAASALDVGDAAPQPTAVNQDGAKVSFADVYSKGVTLVYFYPKADTPGCTAEACSLRDSYADLRAAGVQIIGVSEDQAGSQKKFQEKYNLPFTLIADTDAAVANAFGVPLMPLVKLTKRQSFIIKGGKIAWADKSASTKQQGDDVRKALAGLGVTVAAAKPADH